MSKYPECEKLSQVRDKSQVIGEFLDWLVCEKEISLVRFTDRDTDDPDDPGYEFINTSIERLLAEFFEIDLNKVEKEKCTMLGELREARDNVVPMDKPQDWYFTFGCGQEHAGHYCVIHGTYIGAREKMFRRYGGQWSMQYPSADAAGVERWELKELK